MKIHQNSDQHILGQMNVHVQFNNLFLLTFLLVIDKIPQFLCHAAKEKKPITFDTI